MGMDTGDSADVDTANDVITIDKEDDTKGYKSNRYEERR